MSTGEHTLSEADDDAVEADPRFENARLFLDALFEPNDLVEVRPILLSRDIARQQWFRNGDEAARKQALLWAEKLNAAGWDVYFGVNPRSRLGGKAEDVALFRALCADFDGGCTVDEAMRRIQEAGLPEPSVIVHSGGGVHVYWILVTSIADTVRWSAAQARISRLLQCDESLSDSPQVLRIPDYINTKYPEKPRVRLVEVHKEHRYDLSEFLPSDGVLAAPGVSAGGRKAEFRGEAAAGNDVLFLTPRAGERHPALYRFACLQVSRTAGFDRPHVIQELKEIVWSLSQTHCSPPKKPEEREGVERAVECAVKWRREIEAREGAVPDLDTEDKEDKAIEAFVQWVEGGEATAPAVEGLALTGLERRYDSAAECEEWFPGEWRLQTVESDPPEVRLIVPAWQETPCGGVVVFSMADFLFPTRVAQRVFEATHRVMLAANPRDWSRVWNGWEKRDDDNRVVKKISGLRAKLIESAERVAIGESSKRYSELAAAFLGILSRGVALEDRESQDPDEGGRPIWCTPDKLWFRWARIWEDIQRTQKVEGREKADLKRRICKAVGAPDFVHDRFVSRGRRLSYVVFTREWLDALQGLADGTDGVTET